MHGGVGARRRGAIESLALVCAVSPGLSAPGSPNEDQSQRPSQVASVVGRGSGGLPAVGKPRPQPGNAHRAWRQSKVPRHPPAGRRPSVRTKVSQRKAQDKDVRGSGGHHNSSWDCVLGSRATRGRKDFSGTSGDEQDNVSPKRTTVGLVAGQPQKMSSVTPKDRRGSRRDGGNKKQNPKRRKAHQ